MEKTLNEIKAMIQSGDIVFVDCFTTWCGPCKSYTKLLEKDVIPMLESMKNVHFVKLNVEESEHALKWAQSFGLDIVPSIIMFKNGQNVLVSYEDARTGKKSEKVTHFRGYLANIRQILTDVLAN